MKVPCLICCSVLIVHVNGEDAFGNKVQSCLNLVDLAGSERVDRSEVTGDGLKEAQHINKSLSCLGDVITALAEKKPHVPYRNSKLTLVLQKSLGGSAKTLMFAHVSPEEDSFGETLSTLKFAQRASTVELGAARSNRDSSEVLELKAQVESLKKALANREASSQIIKPKDEGMMTPSEKPKAIPQTPCLTRGRRLSLEGQCSSNKDDHRFRRPRTPPPPPRMTKSQVFAVPPQSPTESAAKCRVEKDAKAKTPEPAAVVSSSTTPHRRNELQTPTGKASQIRKSLRTIGKLINGSDNGKKKKEEAKSPIASSNGRTLRRQSLTGILPPPPPENSRRSSLGWR
ncbi:unnamed protein product [Cuscuta campestris]|uniref:Kinesin motor domain-containing protein n=1 Tax=Cuscuta campestris TaxID=132261 RepID=A0A484LPT6_9ASTE|nr:unnamed protein product [Cuscuta campestris]